jgi:hypothetical protein
VLDALLRHIEIAVRHLGHQAVLTGSQNGTSMNRGNIESSNDQLMKDNFKTFIFPLDSLRQAEYIEVKR